MNFSGSGGKEALRNTLVANSISLQGIAQNNPERLSGLPTDLMRECVDNEVKQWDSSVREGLMNLYGSGVVSEEVKGLFEEELSYGRVKNIERWMEHVFTHGSGEDKTWCHEFSASMYSKLGMIEKSREHEMKAKM